MIFSALAWWHDYHFQKIIQSSIIKVERRVSFLTVFFWKALSLCSPYPLPTTTLPPALELIKDALAENWLVDFLFLYYVYLALSLFFCPIVPRSSSTVRHRLFIIPTYYNTTESTDWCQQPPCIKAKVWIRFNARRLKIRESYNTTYMTANLFWFLKARSGIFFSWLFWRKLQKDSKKGFYLKKGKSNCLEI